MASIQYEIDKITNNNEKEVGSFLEDTYTDTYYHTLFDNDKFNGFASSYSSISPDVVRRAVNSKYFGNNYSTRVWNNEKNLMYVLNQEIPRGLTLGYNPKKLARLVDKKLDTNYNNTVRLIRTEYAKTLNDATIQGYKACGIKQYEILATLDSRTSDICRSLDGNVYDVSEAEVGINYPPFHPNCRTTTIAHFEPDEIDEEYGTTSTRLAKDEDGNYIEIPSNITYDEWYKGLKNTGDKKEHYE